MYSTESPTSHLAYSPFLPQDNPFSHSHHEESAYDTSTAPSPWAIHSDNLRLLPFDGEHNHNLPLDTPSDLDQSASHYFQHSGLTGSDQVNPFSQGDDEASMSPAAMFLSAFSSSAPSPLAPDSEGYIIAGYELGPVIGHGGFSTIRRASSPAGGVVAVKIVRHSDLAKQEDPSLAQKRLSHEAHVWSTLSHEHILPLFSSVQTDYADYFFSLLCPAGSLFDILKRDGRPALPHDDAGMMFRQVVRGLRYLHETVSYVHRDIKLENILVDDMGVCKICDFGMARKIGELDVVEPPMGDSTGHQHRSLHQSKRQGNGNLPVHLSLMRHHGGPRHRTSTPVDISAPPTPTHPAHVFQPGSLPYASPELLSPQQSLKSNCANPAQDMWALGIMLYALLTGQLPFNDSFEPRLQMKILNGAYNMPPGIGRGAERVLRGCLDPSVHSRWTIAMVDEMAWGVGWGDVDDISVLNEADFDIIDPPSHRSAWHSKSRSPSRVGQDRDSDAPMQGQTRASRSRSRASVVTSDSASTRSTSRSVSRHPPSHNIQARAYDALSNSVLSTASSLSYLAPYESAISAFIASPPSLERGRQHQKSPLDRRGSPGISLLPSTPTDQVSDRFSAFSDVPKDPFESDFSVRDASRGRKLFGRDNDRCAGNDTLDNTARWALRHGLKRGVSVGPLDIREELLVQGHERLCSVQLEDSLESARRAESTPPAPSLWPARPRVNGKEGSPLFRFPDIRDAGGFLRESSSTPIPISKSATRSRSTGV